MIGTRGDSSDAAGNESTDTTIVKVTAEATSGNNNGSSGGSGGGGNSTTITPAVPTVVVLPVIILNDIAGHWAEANIIELVNMGAITGYPDHSFKPDKTITRAEFAITLVKAFNLQVTGGQVFKDSAAHWAKEYIATANTLVIVGGYGNGLFGPDDPITREQMAVMIVKAVKLESLVNGSVPFLLKMRPLPGKSYLS